jgi:hypothetical protein
MSDTAKSERQLITSPDQIPESFPSWEAEDEFWRTHDFADGVLEEGEEVEAEFFKGLGVANPKDEQSDPLRNTLSILATAILSCAYKLASTKLENSVLHSRIARLEGNESEDAEMAMRLAIVRAAETFDNFDMLDDILPPGQNIFLKKQEFLQHMYDAVGVEPPTAEPSTPNEMKEFFRGQALESLSDIEEKLYPDFKALFNKNDFEDLLSKITQLRRRLENPNLTVDQHGDLFQESFDLLAETAVKIGARKQGEV